MIFENINVLSRKSDLAVIQAHEFGRVLLSKYPSININFKTKSTSGDKDLQTPLSEMPNEGVFTDDLRDDLIKKNCDIIIHSWKDLPLDVGSETEIAITLNRADERDLLFIKKNNIDKIKNERSIFILSSSPRRKYNLENFITDFLPFQIQKVHFQNIRGNILTRFKKFIESDSDGFVVAKAAIDRLLNADLKLFPEIKKTLLPKINKCYWNVVPLSVNPSSPGQGALAIEIRSNDNNLKKILLELNNKEDYENVILERGELQKYGGGCHQKIGVSFQSTHFGKIKSSKGETDKGIPFQERIIYKNSNDISSQQISLNEIFPENLSDHSFFKRNVIESCKKELTALRNKCIWISRQSALPLNQEIHSSNVIWVSGLETWKKLAERGIWVNGTSDGLGEDSDLNIETLTTNQWIKLTHLDAPPSKIRHVIATYQLKENEISLNIANKKYFYWMSSSAFKYVIDRHPNIRDKIHFCGPGNTYKEIKNILADDSKNLFIELSYNDWKNKILQAIV